MRPAGSWCRWRRGLLSMLLLLHLRGAGAGDEDVESEEDADCGLFVNVSNLTQLKEYLVSGPHHIFMDIDQVVAMPDAPFVSDLPGAEIFLNTIRQSGSGCSMSSRQWPRIFHMMDQTRVRAPLKLTDDDFPSLIKELRVAGKQVLALTSRDKEWGYSLSFSSDGFMHTHATVEALAKWGVKFDPLPKKAKKFGNHTKVGGFLMAGAIARGKTLTEVIASAVPKRTKAPIVLVHSNDKRLRGALLARGKMCLNGIHFLGARDREQADVERVNWLCNAVKQFPKEQLPNIDCELCLGGSEGNEEKVEL